MPRKKFNPTDENRQRVKALAGVGVSQEQICRLMGIRSVNTLRKYFASELIRGPLDALTEVRTTAFRLATSGRNPGMTIRWLERRANWKPGFRSEAERHDRHRWIVEQYQPELADDDPRLHPLEVQQNDAPGEWEGDSPADDDD